MHTDLQLVLVLTGLMLFAHWSGYVMGAPLTTHVDSGAILFLVPYHLAVQRLKLTHRWDAVLEGWRQEYRATGDDHERARALRNHRAEVVLTAQPVFTWERSLLCPVCLHWWLTLNTMLAWYFLDTHVAVAHLGTAALTYLFLHLLIRKI